MSAQAESSTYLGSDISTHSHPSSLFKEEKTRTRERKERRKRREKKKKRRRRSSQDQAPPSQGEDEDNHPHLHPLVCSTNLPFSSQMPFPNPNS
jgi:hypothetical protein